MQSNHTELIEGETYQISSRGLGGREVTVTDVGVEFVEVEAANRVGRRLESETEVYDKAEAQTTFQRA